MSELHLDQCLVDGIMDIAVWLKAEGTKEREPLADLLLCP